MSQKLSPVTALLLTVPPLLWAGNAVVGRMVNTMVPPMTLNLLRWLLAGLLAASTLVVTAALGISIIAPTLSFASKATPFPFSSAMHSASTAFARSSSSLPLIIGYINRTSPCALARKCTSCWPTGRSSSWCG